MSDSAATDQTPEDLYWGAFYLSRILTSNLRCLLAEQGELELGRIRIRGRGETKSTTRRIVPPGAGERETGTLLRRLLARAAKSGATRAPRIA